MKNKREFMITARKQKGLSQTELAKLVGVTNSTITQYESGQRFPKPEVLIQICKVLDIDIEEFYLQHLQVKKEQS